MADLQAAGPLDVLCAADLCVDLILTGDVRPRFGQVEQLVDDYCLELGGSANIFASQFVRLGGRAGVIGSVGTDPFGTFVLERLDALGVDASRVRRRPGLKTGIGVALTEPDDRAILTVPGSIDAMGPAELTGELAGACRHWHIASYFLLDRLRASWPGWLAKLRAAGVTTSLDTNWDPDGRWEGARELLPLVDVFLPNEAEALAISGQRDLFAAGRALAARGPLVAIKRGSTGAACFQGERHWEIPPPEPAVHAPAIADSIGAGDCFDAGFLRAWQLGRPIDACLALGVRCGRESLAAMGGIEAQLVERVS